MACFVWTMSGRWAKIDRHGEGFETSPAPNQSDRVRIIMATPQIRPIRVNGNFAHVPLTKGYTAIVDADDVHLLLGRNWSALEVRRRDGSVRSVYAVGTINGRFTYMHRLILAVPDNLKVDHRDGIGLDNRRANLRTATELQNAHNARRRVDNKSGSKGVIWHGGAKKWMASIRVNGHQKYLGTFSNITDATAAYAKASAELHGEYGRTG